MCSKVIKLFLPGLMGGHIGTFSGSSLYLLARLIFATYFLFHPLTAILNLLSILLKKALCLLIQLICPWCIICTVKAPEGDPNTEDIPLDVSQNTTEDGNERISPDIDDEIAQEEGDHDAEAQEAHDSDEEEQDEDDRHDAVRKNDDSGFPDKNNQINEVDEISSGSESLGNNLGNADNAFPEFNPKNTDSERASQSQRYIDSDADDGLLCTGEISHVQKLDKVELDVEYEDDFISEEEEIVELKDSPVNRLSTSSPIAFASTEQDSFHEAEGLMDSVRFDEDEHLTPLNINIPDSYASGHTEFSNAQCQNPDNSEIIQINVQPSEGL
jgi:hypothetical protein